MCLLFFNLSFGNLKISKNSLFRWESFVYNVFGKFLPVWQCVQGGHGRDGRREH